MIIAAPAAKLQYTEIWNGPHNASLVTTWENLDLTSIVDPGTRYANVLISMICSAGFNTAGVREDGSALNRYVTDSGAYPRQFHSMIVKVPASRIIEIYANSNIGVGAIDFYIGGYWS